MSAPVSGGSTYAAGMVAVVASTSASVVAGIGGLWLLNQVLSKEMFGGYAFAMNVVALLSIVGVLGLDRLLLLRIAGLSPGDGTLRGSGLAARAALAVGIASVALAAGFWFGADRLGAGPEDAFWLRALAPAILPIALAAIAQAWFQANHRVAEAIVLPGLVDLARASLVALVWLGGGGPWGVAAAVIVAACLPVAVILAKAGGSRRRMPRRLRPRDVAEGAFVVVQNLSMQGMRSLDLIVVGLVASGSVTADYAVASRLALFGDMGRQSLRPTFTPRVRRRLSLDDAEGIAREFHAVRLGSVLFALGATAFFSAVGRPLLGLFGPYEGAFGALAILAASYLVESGAGLHAIYLAMSGEVRASAAIRAGTLLGVVVALAVLAPRYGPIGAASGMLLTQTLSNVASALLLRRRTGFVSVPPAPLMLLSAAVLVLCATGAGLLQGPAAGSILAALAGLALLLERRVAGDLLRLLRGR